MKIAAIANLLNHEGIAAEAGAIWTACRVRQLLTTLHRGKSKGALGDRRNRPRSEWVRVAGALEPVVSKETFDAVQRQFRQPKPRNPTDTELLDELRLVLRERGRLSRALIDAHPATHCASVIAMRFGGLVRAMRLIGAEPSRRQTAGADKALRLRPQNFRCEPLEPQVAFAALQAHFARLGYVSANTIANHPDLPSAEWIRRQYGGMARVYELLGYQPTEKQRRHLAQGPELGPPVQGG